MVFALGVCGELQEHLLQTCAFGVAEFDEGHVGLVGDVSDQFRVGLDPQRPAGSEVGALVDCGWDAGLGVMDAGDGEGGGQLVGVSGADVGSGAGEELSLGAVGDDAAVSDDDEIICDDLDLVEQVRGE
jgi:hypothetical protein